MKLAIKPPAAVFVVMLIVAIGTAIAHGGKGHASKSGAVVREQKAWGIAGDAKAVKRTVELKMTDNMRFTPDRIDVREGDTIRFVLRNHGKLMHEFVIGTRRSSTSTQR
jgi:uncharacterized cupredoxin-like copper-binding protein